MPTLQQIISAEFDFEAISALLTKLYTHPHIDSLLEVVRGFIASLDPIVYAIALALIALAFAFLGKRFLLIPTILVGIPTFAYAGGAAYVAPKISALIGDFIPVDAVVVGIVFAVVAAVLFLPIYFVGIALVGGYSTYLVLYPVLVPMLGDAGMIASLAVAVGVVVVIFVFRKWFEMAATAALGGYILMWAVYSIVTLPFAANCAVWAVTALLGFIIQVKTRKRF